MNEKKTVWCRKFNKELSALPEPPLKGPIGALIAQNISEQAWLEWVEIEMKIINEERLDLSEERAQIRLYEAMLEHLNLNDLVELKK